MAMGFKIGSPRARSFMMMSNGGTALLFGHLGYALPEQNQILNGKGSFPVGELRVRIVRAGRPRGRWAAVRDNLTALGVALEHLTEDDRIYVR